MRTILCLIALALFAANAEAARRGGGSCGGGSCGSSGGCGQQQRQVLQAGLPASLQGQRVGLQQRQQVVGASNCLNGQCGSVGAVGCAGGQCQISTNACGQGGCVGRVPIAQNAGQCGRR